MQFFGGPEPNFGAFGHRSCPMFQKCFSIIIESLKESLPDLNPFNCLILIKNTSNKSGKNV